MSFSTSQQLHLDLNVPFPAGGEDLKSVNDLIGYLSKAATAKANAVFPVVPANVGPEEPGPDGRSHPWFRFDGNGRFLGIQHYNTNTGEWVRAGAVGEILTVFTTEDTVEEDRKAKGLTGSWALADDGEYDLTGESAFFAGAAPGYTRYTVYRL